MTNEKYSAERLKPAAQILGEFSAYPHLEILPIQNTTLLEPNFTLQGLLSDMHTLDGVLGLRDLFPLNRSSIMLCKKADHAIPNNLLN